MHGACGKISLPSANINQWVGALLRLPYSIIMKDPLQNIPFDFDINKPPAFPKQLNPRMQKRVDETALKAQANFSRGRTQYAEWLEAAKWYLAYKSHKQGIISEENLELYKKLANGIDNTTSLQFAFNQTRRYYRGNKK